MPVMASTASVSGRPWSMHSECQVQNEVAWPMTARSRRRSSSAPPNGAARTSPRSLSRPRRRGELHTMWNAGPEPARMIEVISPAGFEHFFREMADLAAAGPPQLPEVMALADRYGLQFGQPDWLPDLIARYHLTPPPGV